MKVFHIHLWGTNTPTPNIHTMQCIEVVSVTCAPGACVPENKILIGDILRTADTTVVNQMQMDELQHFLLGAPGLSISECEPELFLQHLKYLFFPCLNLSRFVYKHLSSFPNVSGMAIWFCFLWIIQAVLVVRYFKMQVPMLCWGLSLRNKRATMSPLPVRLSCGPSNPTHPLVKTPHTCDSKEKRIRMHWNPLEWLSIPDNHPAGYLSKEATFRHVQQSLLRIKCRPRP